MTEVDAQRAEPASTGPAVAQDRARPRRVWLVEALWAIGSGSVALALAAIFYRIWDAQAHVPMYTSGDVNFSLLLIKSVMSNGWVGVDHHLGFPFGSALYDDSVAYGDSFHLLIVKVLALGSSDPVVVMNVFYMLTFFLITATAYGVLRDLGFARPAAAVPAILFSLLPYHFFRNENHLFLAAYYSVPLGAWLVLNALRGTPLFRRRDGGGNRLTQWLTGRTLATLAVCFVVGTAEVYYAVFTLLLIVPLALIGAGTARDPRRLIGPLVVVVAIVGSTVAVQLPQLVWHAQHGANTLVGQRLPFESEKYALKLTNLVVPLQSHPIKGFDNLGATYYTNTEEPPGESAAAALGTWFTLGFVLVCLAGFFAAAGRGFVGRPRLLADAGLATGVAFLFATIGGASALIGFYLTAQVRGWNRLSVFIAFFAAVGVAAVLSWAIERWGTSRRGQVALAVGLALVLFTGYKDQLRPGYRPDFDASLVTWRSDSRFVSGIEQRLPGDAAILQFPSMGFPEFGKVAKVEDYDELKGYLHSDRLRWSYGAMKGREPDDWEMASATLPLRSRIAGAVAAGFTGVVVDTYGYDDGGKAILAQLRRATGQAPALVSEDGRQVFFDLTPLAARVAALPPSVRTPAAQAVLRPVALQPGAGFYPEERNDKDTWTWGRASATFDLDNDAKVVQRLRVRFALRTFGDTPQTVVLHLPAGGTQNVVVPPRRAKKVSLSLAVPPGDRDLRLTTNAPVDTSDGRDLHVQVLDLERSDPGLDQVADALR